MLLLADSGSTKTTWILLEEGQVKKTIHTPGLNPYFLDAESIEAILKADLIPGLLPDSISEIHFYGAGCSTENNSSRIKNCLALFFRDAEIMVHHDILGAARSLFGKNMGIAGILGTGCNSCYYDGKEIFALVPSLGYLFGDEGAGSYLGKQLMGSYLRGDLPADLRTGFDQQYGLTLEDILNAVYNKPFPNRFLASFSEFISPRQDHPFIKDLLSSSFREFFASQICKYPDHQTLPVSLTGSVAYVYRDIIRQVAVEFAVQIETISQSPVEGLIRYHLSEK